VVDYLLVLPDREDAEDLAEELAQDPALTQVRVVREALAGEDDAEDHEWAVYVRADTIDDPRCAAAQALRERLAGLAAQLDGWVDEDVASTG
jgi:hypothetical protein